MTTQATNPQLFGAEGPGASLVADPVTETPGPELATNSELTLGASCTVLAYSPRHSQDELQLSWEAKQALVAHLYDPRPLDEQRSEAREGWMTAARLLRTWEPIPGRVSEWAMADAAKLALAQSLGHRGENGWFPVGSDIRLTADQVGDLVFQLVGEPQLARLLARLAAYAAAEQAGAVPLTREDTADLARQYGQVASEWLRAAELLWEESKRDAHRAAEREDGRLGLCQETWFYDDDPSKGAKDR